MPLFVPKTTRDVLQALRQHGLTVNYGGVSPGMPAKDHPQVQVVDSLVLNANAYSVLGYGSWNHPRRPEVHADVVEQAVQALARANFDCRVTELGQVLVTGRKFRPER